MYKNLLYLKNYDGNVEDLGLDFTIVNSEIGQTQVRKSAVSHIPQFRGDTSPVGNDSICCGRFSRDSKFRNM
jgi:hypothetical protein